MRHVLVHYHIFKNAGSSLDAILMDSFGDSWRPWDPGAPHSAHGPRELIEFIKTNPSVAAISSHTIRPPFPIMRDVAAYPLVFVRHPILRVASVFKYERSLDGETESQRVAMNSSFAEYVRWRLRPEVEPVVRDFQTLYLSGEHLRYEDPRDAVASSQAYARALGILGDLPVFGIVERFGDSVRQFNDRLKHVFPQIQWREAHENVTEPWLGTLDAIRAEIGNSLYDELEACNAFDLSLYKTATSLFEANATAIDTANLNVK